MILSFSVRSIIDFISPSAFIRKTAKAGRKVLFSTMLAKRKILSRWLKPAKAYGWTKIRKAITYALMNNGWNRYEMTCAKNRSSPGAVLLSAVAAMGVLV